VRPAASGSASARAAARATSATNTGCIRVSPPPISGSTGLSTAMAAKRLKNWSSGPNTIEGRRMTAPGMAPRTAASPSALVRAYCDAEAASAPIAEISTKLRTPSRAAVSATTRGPAA
jgi:hypothetical protein